MTVKKKTYRRSVTTLTGDLITPLTSSSGVSLSTGFHQMNLSHWMMQRNEHSKTIVMATHWLVGISAARYLSLIASFFVKQKQASITSF